MPSVLSQPRFHSEDAAYAWVEERLWPNGPVCPHCGARAIGKLAGKSTRLGVYKCCCLPQALPGDRRDHL